MGDYWFKSYQTLRDHPKTKKLTRLLDVRLTETIGTLNCLWWWGIDYADLETGDTSKYAPEEIADACEWHGDPSEFVDALVKCHFLDEHPLRLHAWDEHLGPLNQRRMYNRTKAAESYARRKLLAQEEAAAEREETERLEAFTQSLRNEPESGTRQEPSGTRLVGSGRPEESRTRQGSTPEGVHVSLGEVALGDLYCLPSEAVHDDHSIERFGYLLEDEEPARAISAN